MTRHDPKVQARIEALTGVDRANRGAGILAGQMRQTSERQIMAEMKVAATPPPEMQAAPMAPAQGPMKLQPLYTMLTSGMRQKAGAHFRSICALEIAVAHARDRHAMRTPDAPFVAPYSPGQIAVARDYRDLVEWRDGSAVKCASLEAGRGGGGSWLFIDTFIQQGAWLEELRRRIGTGMALDIRRHMDRGDERCKITVRAALDLLVLGGKDLSVVLKRYGWEANGRHRKELRTAICGALDRMQGYRA